MFKENLNSNVYYFFSESEKDEKKIKIHYEIAKVDFFLKNELTNIARLRDIKNFKTMFFICDKSNELNISKYETDFSHFKQGSKIREENSILLKYEKKDLINLKNYLKSLSSSKKYLYSIIHFYGHLLVSLQNMLDNHLIHNNIRFNNIVICKTSNNPLITDFSFSINTLSHDLNFNLRHLISVYDPTYIEWPIEFHLLSYLNTNNLKSLSLINIESIINELINNLNLLFFGENFVSTFKDKGIKYFSKYVNKDYEFIVMDILKYKHTWDNYSLSLMFLKIVIYLHGCLKNENKFIIDFMKLLVCNLSFNPEERLSIEDSTNKFEYLIDNFDLVKFKELIKNLHLS